MIRRKIGTCLVVAVFSGGLFGCGGTEPSDEGVLDSDSYALRCSAGATRCRDANRVQTCNRRGHWSKPTQCENGCSGGACNSPPSPVAAALDGQMLITPCLIATENTVCATMVGGCPIPNVADRALSGALLTDKTFTIGGSPTTTYTISLRVQGVVEAKMYTSSTDAESTLGSPAANGFATGGTPSLADAYGVYMVRVSNPPQDYFLNSVWPPGVSNHTTYGVDYAAQIRATGGSTVRLVAADSNCSEIRNCGPSFDGNSCAAPIVLVPTASAVEKNPSFDFNTAYNGQWLVMTVTDVTDSP
jgi:hypothetical protein